MPASGPDWIAICRSAAQRAGQAIAPLENRARELGRGEGGDTTLAVDQAAEDAIVSELEALETPLTVISEERGRLELGGGGPPLVVVDPIDGSVNAKRGLPFHAVSIAVADGAGMESTAYGYVLDLASGGEWWAERGAGAFRDGQPLPRLDDGPLEVLGLETARPKRVAEAAPWIAGLEARRLRTLGSVALALCLVADGRFDAMVSLRAIRSVDVAAGQLIVREAGGTVSFPEAGPDAPLGLEMRSRVIAARSQALAERLLRS
jgi:myo-inositol-1(or 4)-monophosphatase